MAKKDVQVKSYTRKDGTKVRASNRAVMVVGEGKKKRQNTLRGHLKKGAKITGGITAGLGALNGALVGGAVGGPIGALGGATVYGAAGGVGGAFTGAGYGAGVYKARKMLAKDKSFRNFDYAQEDLETIEFKRGRDKKKRRKRRQNKLGRHINKGFNRGAAIGAGVAGLGILGAVASRNPGLAAANLAAAPLTIVGNAGQGAVIGAGIYGGRKLLAKDRSKRNFDYSMFIGNQEENSLMEFGRGPDRKKRKSRRKNGPVIDVKNKKIYKSKGAYARSQSAKVVGGLAGAAGLLAAVKNRKALGGIAGDVVASGRNKAADAIDSLATLNTKRVMKKANKKGTMSFDEAARYGNQNAKINELASKIRSKKRRPARTKGKKGSRTNPEVL